MRATTSPEGTIWARRTSWPIVSSDRDGNPPGGWYPEQAVSIEEALRAYTIWPARASGKAALTGTLETGKWADVTVMSIDPLAVTDPAELLAGEALLTIVGGRIVFNALSTDRD